MLFCGFGEKGVTAESVTEKTTAQALRYLASLPVVSTYLSDQLLLPLALTGDGSFTTDEWSEHAATNAAVIQQFLPINIHIKKVDEKNGKSLWTL